MLIHPSSLMFTLVLILSMALAFSSDNLFTIWLSLEINILSFIPLALNKNSLSAEAMFKYFLIQSIASALILTVFLINTTPFTLSFYLMLALALKLGAAPTHQWVPMVSNSLAWISILLLFTIQKLIPLMALSTTTAHFNPPYLLEIFIVSSAIIGSVSGLTQTSMRKILAFSSISHMAWLLSTASISHYVWIFYMIFYASALLPLILWLNQQQISTLPQIFMANTPKTNLMLPMSLLSMGGLPPFTGFIAKLMASQTMLLYNLSFTLMILLTSSFISLFFYVRVLLASMMQFSQMTTHSNNTPNLTLNFTLMNMAGVFCLAFIFAYL